MKKLLLLCLFASSSCLADVAASNVVADVCAYTGSVVTVSGKIDAVRKDSMSSCSYIVSMQGLGVRVFFDPNQMILNRKTVKFQRATFDLIDKPYIGQLATYSGIVKKEMGKPFLITAKKD